MALFFAIKCNPETASGSPESYDTRSFCPGISNVFSW